MVGRPEIFDHISRLYTKSCPFPEKIFGPFLPAGFRAHNLPAFLPSATSAHRKGALGPYSLQYDDRFTMLHFDFSRLVNFVCTGDDPAAHSFLVGVVGDVS